MSVKWRALFPVDPEGPTWSNAWRRAYTSMWPQIWATGILLVVTVALTLLGWL